MTKQKRNKDLSGKEILKNLKPWKKGSSSNENKVQPVIVGQSIYSLNNPDKNAENVYPDCAQEKCGKYQREIRQICKEEGWPPHHTILVCNTEGQCCFCYCS